MFNGSLAKNLPHLRVVRMFPKKPNQSKKTCPTNVGQAILAARTNTPRKISERGKIQKIHKKNVSKPAKPKNKDKDKCGMS